MTVTVVNHKSIDTEESSIGQLALGFLTKDPTVKLPKKIHDMLQNVLTKREGAHLKYRDVIVLKTTVKDSTSQNTDRHQVIRNRSHAIYNILCLYVFMDTSDIKRLFKHYYETKRDVKKQNFSMIYQNQDSQYLAYFCFGVDMDRISAIEEHLLNPDFDLFTQKLPSPFKGNIEGDLSPLLTIVNEGIDWAGYQDLYRQAEHSFEQKKFDKVKLLLDQLEEQAVVNLPVVDSLRRKINSIEEESQEALDYLQKLLH